MMLTCTRFSTEVFDSTRSQYVEIGHGRIALERGRDWTQLLTVNDAIGQTQSQIIRDQQDANSVREACAQSLSAV
jgi:hypothetical protein